MAPDVIHTNLPILFLISVLTLLLQCGLKFYEFELILTHFIASMRGALEINFKDTNMHFGFISACTHWKFKRGKNSKSPSS